MLPEITIMQCLIPIYCRKGTKNIQLSNVFQKLQGPIALLEFTDQNGT